MNEKFVGDQFGPTNCSLHQLSQCSHISGEMIEFTTMRQPDKCCLPEWRN